ncbi:MAG: DUF1015 domain-containing protein [Sedimentisphaerales bacterium]|nr:DUF1015 domain-containing protein [Sedimentisphaerales bacterium]
MEVRPFKAFRFNAEVVGDTGRCIAPPYDVINDEDREKLYAASPYNVVRITRGKTTPSDDGQDNQYTRAAAFLTDWIGQGALKADEKDTIYAYVQDFEINGEAFQRLSFIALGKLEDFGKTVKPHEQVFEKPMLDRLNLKRATGARFGLVFMLYEDPQQIADAILQRATAQEPLVDFTDEQDVRHRLFAITGADDINAIVAMMSDKSCIIADGHHRYTTGLTYARENGNPAASHQMLAFTNTRQKGLLVLATHRVVGGIDGFAGEAFLTRLKDTFDIVEIKFAATGPEKEQAKQKMLAEMKARHDNDENAFGVYMGHGAFHVIVLKDAALMANAAPEKSPAWRALDVSVLQKLVLEAVLHFDEDRMGDPDFVGYVKDTPNAIDTLIAQIDAGKRQIAFFTNPVKMEQLVEVTEAGERMPHKSTYFYPKMYTGLTIQKI